MDDKIDFDTSLIERRHLTVLECDLVGSTALAHKLDPEELRDLILAYQDCVLSWIEKLDGFFVQFAGDAIWAYFGYPKAHEDDAIRAIQAGLGIVRAVGLIKIHGESLNVRVGIASGLCIVGNLRQIDDISTKRSPNYITAIGDPPNLAARLQALVTPGSVAVADETRSLVGNIFEFEDLGVHKLKGFSEITRAWRAIAESIGQSRFRALRPNTRSPLIGRENELETIKGLWKETCKNNGQIVYFSGDPGIGKSRLVASIADDIVGQHYPQWWLQCSEQMQDSAFSPMITLIRSQAGLSGPEDSHFEQLVRQYPELDDEAHYLLAELISVETEYESDIAQMSASRRRERLYEVLLELIESTSNNKPLLLVVEDVHWIDPSTKAFLQRLTLRSTNLPLLMLITSRTINDSDKAFMELFHVHNFHIEQLQRDDCFLLLRSLWEGEKLPKIIAEQIVKQTDGVPLFIEDVIFSLRHSTEIDSHDMLSGKITVPAKLSDHLMSRIDRLGDSKHIAQIGAVVGREFSLAMIASMTKLSPEILKRKVATLIDTGLLLEAKHDNEQSYVFKHAMIRDAAYESLLLAHRRELHGQIAEWFVTERPALRNSHPETIAYHYKHAGEFNLAIDFWLKAGKRYNSRCNYVESIIHLKNAYKLVSDLPASRGRSRIELDIVTALGVAQAGSGGISGESTGKTYDLARKLCKDLDYPVEVFTVLAGAGSFSFIRSDYTASQEIALQSIELAEKKSILAGKVIGNRILGAVEFVTGNFDAAIKSLCNAIQIYDDDNRIYRKIELTHSLDHKTTSLCYLSLTNITIGNINLALELSHESLAHSETINIHSRNCALCYLAAIRHLRDDPAELIADIAKQSLDLSLEEGYASWTGMSRLLKGEALCQLGNLVDGMQEIEQGVNEHSNLMAKTFLPLAQSILAKGYLAAKCFEKALKVLIKAEALSVNTRQYWYLPEIQRLHAETLIQLKRYDAAEECYRKAYATANKIGAKFWLQKIQRSRATNQNHLNK